MKRLIELKRPRDRFARSINVERDAGSDAVAGYLPVGRALEVIGRFGRALDRDDVEAAISVTGPYGSGKSSLALLLDALLGPDRDPARLAASGLIADVAPESLARIDGARRRFRVAKTGFIRASVTAQREPIAVTVSRALVNGLDRFAAPPGSKAAVRRLTQEARALCDHSNPRDVDVHTVRDLVREVATVAPVLLLIDEFGKNLEAFAESGGESDLFLLQELAEWSRGGDGIPLVLVTLQHMAFDEYATGASSAQRREWAKVQGRFEDVPFVDSAVQTRALIGAAFERPARALVAAQSAWGAKQARALKALGLSELAGDEKALAACWPLHPIALAVLPDLCERYGQNERTLFSFLAGHEPNSVATMLGETQWDGKTDLPVVRLDALYDYFIESASNLVSISANASRWLEIDTRIRDASGLKAPARRVLKAIGILNLVSAGGSVRASEDLVAYAAADGRSGTRTPKEVVARIQELEAAGLVTYREFADEYRVWQGSDFDLRNAVEVARRRAAAEPAAALLNRVFPLDPAVAGRHSHVTGTLRAFGRAWVEGGASSVDPITGADRFDGVVLYTLGETPPVRHVTRREGEKPVAFVSTPYADVVVDAAIEIAAIDEVLSSFPELENDWVARRELAERRFEGQRSLAVAVHAAYAGPECRWHTCPPGENRRWRSAALANLSSELSGLCDEWYSAAPRIRNDLIMRHELSSQAAKARRLLAEAMINHASASGLGIAGGGPDATLYKTTLVATGLHRETSEGWGFGEPSDSSGIASVWGHLASVLRTATDRRLGVEELYRALAAPPFGVREGVAPVLIIAALVLYADDLALFEHGTFRPALTDDLVERLLRNPANFAIKYFASRRGARLALLSELCDALGNVGIASRTGQRAGSVVGVTSALVRMINTVPEYSRRTRELSADAMAVRTAVQRATEPDDLLFRDIPVAFGHRPIAVNSKAAATDLSEVARRVAAAAIEVRDAYPALVELIQDAVERYVSPGRELSREVLAAHAREVEAQVTDPLVRKLVVALTAEIPDDEAWLAYVAMMISGSPPEAWSDETRTRFLVAIAEAGATFRRLYALNADLAASDLGFDALRFVVTRPDGSEWVHLVGLSEGERTASSAVFESAVDALREAMGVDRARARDLLAAILAEDALGPSAAIRSSSEVGAYDGPESPANRREA